MNKENKIAWIISVMFIIWLSLTAILLVRVGLGYDFITFHIPMGFSAVIFILLFVILPQGFISGVEDE